MCGSGTCATSACVVPADVTSHNSRRRPLSIAALGERCCCVSALPVSLQVRAGADAGADDGGAWCCAPAHALRLAASTYCRMGLRSCWCRPCCRSRQQGCYCEGRMPCAHFQSAQLCLLTRDTHFYL